MSASSSKLDKILSGLEEAPSVEKSFVKTVSVRLPVLDIAKIDVLAGMKDVSRNELLNDVIDAALGELMSKLKDKNPSLAKDIETKAQSFVNKILSEHEPGEHGPHKHKPPKHKRP